MLSQHWIMEALDPTIGYRAYKRQSDTKEEILILSEAGRNGYYLRYCFPIEKTANIDEYNRYITQIGDDLEKGGIQIEIHSDNSFPMMEDVSIHTLKALDAFSGHANHSTGHSHPSDHDLWMKFIYATIFIGETEKVAEHLENILATQLNWSDEWSNRLSIDYEYAVSSMLFFMRIEGVHQEASHIECC